MVRLMTKVTGAAVHAQTRIRSLRKFGLKGMKMLSHRRLGVRIPIVILALLVGQAMTDRSAQAAVEYVRVCSQFGLPGYFYIPGTDICQDANQIASTQKAIADFSSTAYQGIAISSSIVSPFMPSTANFAISGHWATFSGKDALGLGALLRVNNSNFFLSGGIGASTSGGPGVGRAGFMFAW
jgi:hypothetical protein